MPDYKKILDELKPEFDRLIQKKKELEDELGKINKNVEKLERVFVNIQELVGEEDHKSYTSTNQNDSSSSSMVSSVVKWDQKDFDDIIVHIIDNEGRPMTSPELMKVYNSMVSEKKQKGRNSFSGMLSQRVDKTDKYKRITVPELIGRTKHVYGLPKMFEGNTLNPEYKDKLKMQTSLLE